MAGVIVADADRAVDATEFDLSSLDVPATTLLPCMEHAKCA